MPSKPFIGNCTGRLGKDPEIREVKGGNKVAQTSIAVSESWKDKNDDWQEKTSWFQLKGWGYAADKIMRWKKGDEVVVLSGKLELERWEDKNGNEQTTSTINIGPGSMIWKLAKAEPRQAAAAPAADDDDDLPW